MAICSTKPFLSGLKEDNFEFFRIVANYQTSDSRVTNPSDKYRKFTVLSHSGGGFAEAHSVFGAQLRTQGVEVPETFINKDKVEVKLIEGRYKRVVTTAHSLFFDVIRHIFVDERCFFERMKFRSLLPQKITQRCTSQRCHSGEVEHVFQLMDINIKTYLPFSPGAMDSRSGSELSSPFTTPESSGASPSRSSTGSLPFDIEDGFKSARIKTRFSPSPGAKNNRVFFS